MVSVGCYKKKILKNAEFVPFIIWIITKCFPLRRKMHVVSVLLVLGVIEHVYQRKENHPNKQTTPRIHPVYCIQESRNMSYTRGGGAEGGGGGQGAECGGGQVEFALSCSSYPQVREHALCREQNRHVDTVPFIVATSQGHVLCREQKSTHWHCPVPRTTRLIKGTNIDTWTLSRS